MKKNILITMGDPAGVGPEITVKVLSSLKAPPYLPIVVGDVNVLKKAIVMLRKDLKIKEVTLPFKGEYAENEILVYPLSDLKNIEFGIPTIEAARESFNYIVHSVELIKSNLASGVVTCPVNKELICRSGKDFTGHTELIAELCNVSSYVMMLLGATLKVSLVTRHIALKDVPKYLSYENVLLTSEITYKALQRDFGIRCPIVAVAGLNPHCGEGGLFGEEEERLIRPVVRHLREKGWDIRGPFSADTIFYRAKNGEFHAVVSMFHDQGLIPIKLLHFSDGVNVTLGLPIVRTSVDHGTAYDIAGRGSADHRSLEMALKVAHEILCNREVSEKGWSLPT